MTRHIAVTLTLLALAATACGTRVKEWPPVALEPNDYYTDRAATAEAEGAAPSENGESPARNPPGTSGVANDNRSSSPDGPAPDGALPAPVPGTYTYDESGGEEGATSSSITWAVRRGASAVTLTSTESQDDGEFSVTTTSRYRVTKTAFELLSTTTEFNGEAPETCTYKPAVLILKLPLATGDKWKTKSACEGEPADEVEFSITGRATDVIGGKAVKTFVVSMKQSFDSTDDTTGERTTFSFEDTRHVDPATLLTVIEDITFTVDGESSTLHRQLRSLTPA